MKNLIPVCATLSLLILIQVFFLPARAEQLSSPIRLQYASHGHVVGFGVSEMLIANRSHGLTVSLWHSKPVEPKTDDRAASGAGTTGAMGNVETRQCLVSTKTAMPKTMPTTVKYIHPWPGVTVVYRPEKGMIVKSEYQLEAGHIKKGLKKLRLAYNRKVSLDKQGRMLIDYGGTGQMIESPPVAWQETASGKQEVKVKFVKHGGNKIGFEVRGYDERYPLVIDPGLAWNTFLGGTGSDTADGVIVDGNENIIISGFSGAAWGTPKHAYSGYTDVFVAKLDHSGNLLWNTFLGCAGYDYSYGVTTDINDNIVVTGASNGTWGTPKRAFTDNGTNVFVALLDSNGNILWNTFLGYEGANEGYDVATYPSGHIIAVGCSMSSWGTPKNPHTNQGTDIFVARLDENGNLLWNTFFGGAGLDIASKVAVDANANIFVTGQSERVPAMHTGVHQLILI